MSDYNYFQARRTNATKQTDNGAWTAGVCNLFGEPKVEVVDRHSLANAGCYFYAQDGTLAAAAPTGAESCEAITDVTVNTKPIIILRNDATAAQDYRIFLDWVRLTFITVGTSASGTMAYRHAVDTGATRITTVGTWNAVTPVNVNMDSSATATCTLYMGQSAGTDGAADAATSSIRNMGCGILRPATTVAYDTALFVFGRDPQISGMIQGSTAVAHTVISCVPIVLGPSDQYFLHLGIGSVSAHYHIFMEMAFWQR